MIQSFLMYKNKILARMPATTEPQSNAGQQQRQKYAKQAESQNTNVLKYNVLYIKIP